MEEPIKPSQAASNQVSSDRLQLLKSRLKVAKAWSKKPHDAWRKWIKEYEIDNFDDTGEIRDKVRIGYIFRKTENENASIFDDQPDLFLKGKNKDNQVIEDVANGAYDYLWDTQNLEEKIEDTGVYFELTGMGFLGSPWKIKTKKTPDVEQQPILDELGQPMLDEMGQPLMQEVPVEYEVPIIDRPDAEVKNPFKLHFSPETKFNYVLDAEHCPYYFEEMTWIKEKVKAIFGKNVDTTEQMKTDDEDCDEEITDKVEKGSEVEKDDLQRVKVYEYYGTLPEKHAKGIKDADGNAVEWEWDKEYHIFFTNNEELKVEECPYPYKPLFVVGNYGLANKFWKFGDAKHLMPLVQELEIYRSQLLMHNRKMVNPKLLVDLNTEVNDDDLRDPRPGKVIKYSGGVKPEYLSPSNLGSEVQVGVDMVRTDLEKTAPSFDLAGGGSQSQVRSPRGIATYAEAADKGSRRKRKKIARFIRQIIIFQMLQLGMNWTPDTGKTLSIAGKDEPVTQDVLAILSDPDLLNKLDIEVESLSVNKVQQREETLAFWDIAVSAPQVYNVMEVAKDVVQNGFNKRDADRYLIPMEQIQGQAVQQFVQQLAGINPELAAQVMQIAQNPNMAQLGQQPDNPASPTPTPMEQPGDQGMAAPGDMPPMGEF